MNRILLVTAVLLGGWCTSVSGEPPLATVWPASLHSAWPMERVELKDGRRYEGLIESEEAGWIRLIQIRRPNGKPMHLVIHTIAQSAIARVVRLEDARQRAELRRRVQQFIYRTEIEKGREDAIALSQVDKDGAYFHHYRGKWFTLDSNVEESVTRRIIVRVDQVFTAFRQIVAPRTDSQRRLRLVVFGSLAEYQAYLSRRGIAVDHPACFLKDENLVIAGSEMARFAAQLAAIKVQHRQLEEQLRAMKAQLPKRLLQVAQQLQAAGTPRQEAARLLRIKRTELEKQIEAVRRDLKTCQRRNAQTVDQATRQMFARLYHEAFHAYLENYVYPYQQYDVPRWLDEGLAVMLEEGLLESGTLRVDAPNHAALEKLKNDLKGPQPLPLGELLAADDRTFLAADADAERHYVYSWGLAYYLTFEKRLLGSPALDRYVERSAATVDAKERFEKLVDLPLEEFERDWRAYILELH